MILKTYSDSLNTFKLPTCVVHTTNIEVSQRLYVASPIVVQDFSQTVVCLSTCENIIVLHLNTARISVMIEFICESNSRNSRPWLLILSVCL